MKPRGINYNTDNIFDNEIVYNSNFAMYMDFCVLLPNTVKVAAV